MSPVPCTSCHHQAPVQWQCRAMSLHQIRPGLDKSIIPARELQLTSLSFHPIHRRYRIWRTNNIHKWLAHKIYLFQSHASTTLKIFMYFKQFQVCMSCGKSEGRNGGCECNVGVCHLAWTWHQLSFESLDNSGSRTLHYITILSRAWWYLTWRRTAGRWGTLPSACRSWCRCTCGRTPASRSQSEDANQG